MAEGGAPVVSDLNDAYIVEISQSESTKSLFITSKGKLKWNGSFNSLQQFVDEILNIKGKWSSPGGGSKVLQGDEIIIRWYYGNNNTLTLAGSCADELKLKLNSLANSYFESTEDFEDKEEGDGQLKLKPNEMPNGSPEGNGKNNDDPFHIFTNEIKCKFTALQNELNKRIDALSAELQLVKTRDQANHHEDYMSALKKENSDLREENRELKEKIANLTLIASDLNTKVKETEHENRSLITTIKLLHNDLLLRNKNVTQNFEDDNQNQEATSEREQPFTEVTSCKNKKTTKKPIPVTIIRESDTEEKEEVVNTSEFEAVSGAVNTGQIPEKQNIDLTAEVGIPNVSTEVVGGSNRNKKPSKRSTVIIGDSIVKHIDPKKLSQRPVQKFTYPGKTCEEISEAIDNIKVNSDPSHVIIHSGTNNLPIDSVEICAAKVKNLAVKVKAKYPNSKIGVSGLIYREDISVDQRRTEVNEKLKQLSVDYDFCYIDNTVIDSTCLNGSKLHLNNKGTSLLATQFIKFLRSVSGSYQHHKDRSSGFQMSAIKQLGKMLMTLGNQH